MSLITWNDYFVTGMDIIDEQHRWLIGLINEAAPVWCSPMPCRTKPPTACSIS